MHRSKILLGALAAMAVITIRKQESEPDIRLLPAKPDRDWEQRNYRKSKKRKSRK